jgi:hypothetical protein
MCFIDTPEVEKITDLLVHKKHTTPHIFRNGEKWHQFDVDISKRYLFREAGSCTTRHHCYKEN